MVPIMARRPAPAPAAVSAEVTPAQGSAASTVVRLLRAPLPRFLLVGSIGFTVDSVAFSAASGLGAKDFIARAASLAIATAVTWQLNRRFTFPASGRAPQQEGTRYALVAGGVQGFNYGLFLLLRTLAPGAPALAALAVSAGCAAGLSFAGQALITFGMRLRLAPSPFACGQRSASCGHNP